MSKRMQMVLLAVMCVVLAAIVWAFDLMDTAQLNKAVNAPSLLGGTEQGLVYKQLTPYQVVTEGSSTTGTNYIRFSNTTSAQLVVRIVTTNSVVVYEKSTGAWSGRTSLTYVGIND